MRIFYKGEEKIGNRGSKGEGSLKDYAKLLRGCLPRSGNRLHARVK